MVRLLVLFALVLPGSFVFAATPVIHDTTLANGLRIIVKEDHRAPVVVSQVWYKVGSSYEYGGVTGVSHILEHMMFKGTPKYGTGEFSRIVSENGGRENAFTGRDYTAYYQRLEKSRLEISFRLESDRMRHLLLPADEFEKEREVVIEERRMRTDNKPRSQTYEQFQATAFQVSPYKNPVIGWRSDLDSLVVEDLRAWYQRWYSPSNATLVVVGDVDARATIALAKKYFGPLKGEPVAPAKPRLEPKQTGEKRIQVRVPAKLPYLIMGYKVPVYNTTQDIDELYALEVLASVLDGGDSARLSKNLVRGSEVAASAGAGNDMFDRLDNLFTFSAIPSDGVSIAELEQALRKQIEIMKTELVGEAELRRVKTQVVTADIYENDSVFYQAMEIGRLVTAGMDWRLADEYVQRISAVTPEQVRDAARKYLIDEQLTVAELHPLPLESGASNDQ